MLHNEQTHGSSGKAKLSLTKETSCRTRLRVGGQRKKGGEKNYYREEDKVIYMKTKAVLSCCISPLTS